MIDDSRSVCLGNFKRQFWSGWKHNHVHIPVHTNTHTDKPILIHKVQLTTIGWDSSTTYAASFLCLYTTCIFLEICLIGWYLNAIHGAFWESDLVETWVSRVNFLPQKFRVINNVQSSGEWNRKTRNSLSLGFYISHPSCLKLDNSTVPSFWITVSQSLVAPHSNFYEGTSYPKNYENILLIDALKNFIDKILFRENA